MSRLLYPACLAALLAAGLAEGPSAAPPPRADRPSLTKAREFDAPALAEAFREHPKQSQRLYVQPKAGGEKAPGKSRVIVTGKVVRVDGRDVYLETNSPMMVVLRSKDPLPKDRKAGASGGPAFVTRFDGKTIVIETPVTFMSLERKK